MKSVNLKLQIRDADEAIVGFVARMVKPCGIFLGVLAATAILYVLSYAPYIKYRHGETGRPEPISVLASYDFDEDWLQGSHAPYVLVEWLIDETPLAGPLNAWARLWRTSRTFAELRQNRQFIAAVRRLEQTDKTKSRNVRGPNATGETR